MSRLRRRRWWLVLSPLTLVVLLLIVLVGIAVVGMFGAGGAHFAATRTASCSTTGVVGGAAVPVNGSAPGLTPEQEANAKVIVGVALGLGLGPKGALIGVLTANVETDLRNLPGGDRDSVGLFQQRDPWGSFAERHDPTTAATMFFTGGRGGQPGLTSITGWESMDPGVAMQAVQQSQFAGGTSPAYATKLAMAQAATTALLADAPPANPVAASVAAGPPAATIVPLAATPRVCPGSAPAVGVAYSSPAGMEQNDSQDPSSFGWVRAGPMEPLVYQGHSFGQVAAGTAKLWTAMLNELVPLIPGGLNNYLGAYENRQNVNNPSVASFHSYGLALDINYDRNGNGSDPASLQGGQFVLPMNTQSVLSKYGMTWGGTWEGTPDPMHAELHLTPQQVAAWSASQP